MADYIRGSSVGTTQLSLESIESSMFSARIVLPPLPTGEYATRSKCPSDPVVKVAV